MPPFALRVDPCFLLVLTFVALQPDAPAPQLHLTWQTSWECRQIRRPRGEIVKSLGAQGWIIAQKRCGAVLGMESCLNNRRRHHSRRNRLHTQVHDRHNPIQGDSH